MATERGTILWFNWRKSYGFIKRDSGERDAHVHWKDVAHGPHGGRGRFVAEPSQSLQKDDRVEFEVVNTPRGPQAQNVRLVTPSADTKERGEPLIAISNFDFGLK